MLAYTEFASRRKIRTIVVFVFFAALLGCGSKNELTRPMVKNIILQNSEYPIEWTQEITYYAKHSSYRISDDLWSDLINKYNQSGVAKASKKLSTVYDKTLRRDLAQAELIVEFFPDATKYFRGEHKGVQQKVVTYIGDFGEVTGITYNNQDKTSATVEFTTIYTATPFAIFSGHSPSEITNNTTIFRLYDDGWRRERR